MDRVQTCGRNITCTRQYRDNYRCKHPSGNSRRACHHPWRHCAPRKRFGVTVHTSSGVRTSGFLLAKHQVLSAWLQKPINHAKDTSADGCEGAFDVSSLPELDP